MHPAIKTIDFVVNHVLIMRIGGYWFISVSELADVHLMCIILKSTSVCR